MMGNGGYKRLMEAEEGWGHKHLDPKTWKDCHKAY